LEVLFFLRIAKKVFRTTGSTCGILNIIIKRQAVMTWIKDLNKREEFIPGIINVI
jgi:hypothetical protein